MNSRIFSNLAILFLSIVILTAPLAGAGRLEESFDSIALILYGAGSGRLTGTASGAIVRSDGVILTDCSQLDEAREVQVRLRNGEVFDRVELLGIDKRRCVAALKIQAAGLPALEPAPSPRPQPGARVYSAQAGKKGNWSLQQGVISALASADEAGDPPRGGHRLIQFSISSYESPPGVLLDGQARLLGIGLKQHGQGQAVPIHSVLGLADRPVEDVLGEGAALELDRPRSLASREVAAADPDEQLREARTIYVTSSSVFIKPTQLHRALLKQPQFKQWNLKLVKGYQAAKVADLTIQLGRPLFTYYFTFDVTDNHTALVLGSGKVTAFDGNAAAPMLAKQIIALLGRVRSQTSEAEPDGQAGLRSQP